MKYTCEKLGKFVILLKKKLEGWCVVLYALVISKHNPTSIESRVYLILKIYHRINVEVWFEVDGLEIHYGIHKLHFSIMGLLNDKCHMFIVA